MIFKHLLKDIIDLIPFVKAILMVGSSIKITVCTGK